MIERTSIQQESQNLPVVPYWFPVPCSHAKWAVPNLGSTYLPLTVVHSLTVLKPSTQGKYIQEFRALKYLLLLLTF